MYLERACAHRWTSILAPRTGNVRDELTLELSEYLGVASHEIEARLADATERFTREWRERVVDSTDERAVERFYADSQTELFDLARWHAEDVIHYRTPICLDLIEGAGRNVLDFGSGIGSDALVFASAGFEVTLADISDALLSFARWRCQRRGLRVHSVDLKRELLPERRFDVAICFDVLEHIHRPVKTLWSIRRAMAPGALLFVHAPFGRDPMRPMHVVHSDVVTPRMRSIGFLWRADLEREFPDWLWHPHVYESFSTSPVDRLGYRLHDVWLHGPVGTVLAGLYRRIRPRSTAAT